MGPTSGAAAVKWVDLPSPAAGGLGRGTLWPLGLARSRMRDGLQDWRLSGLEPQ